MRGQAVVAGVAVGDGDGDRFGQRGRQAAAPQGAERAPQALQGGRGIRGGAEHGGHGAEGLLDGIEGGLAGDREGRAVKGKSAHGTLQ